MSDRIRYLSTILFFESPSEPISMLDGGRIGLYGNMRDRQGNHAFSRRCMDGP